MSSADASDAPPPMSGRAPLPSSSGDPDGTRALRKVMRLEQVIGEAPNPLTDHPGTGLHAALHKMNLTLAAVAADTAALRASRSTWQERAARVFWLVVGAAIVLAMGAAAAFIAKLHT